MQKINEKAEFIISAGKVEVVVSLILKRTINADGHKVDVDCCEIEGPIARVEGHPGEHSGYSVFPAPIKHPSGNLLIASIGKVGLRAEHKTLVDDAIARIKAHPAWVSKETKIAANRAENENMEARRDRNGYCRKCGSYCYGDCEAN